MSEGTYRCSVVTLAAAALVLFAVLATWSLVIMSRAAENGRYTQYEEGAHYWGNGTSTKTGQEQVFDTRTGTKAPVPEKR